MGNVLLWKRAILGARREAEEVQVLERRDMAGDVLSNGYHAPGSKVRGGLVLYGEGAICYGKPIHDRAGAVMY